MKPWFGVVESLVVEGPETIAQVRTQSRTRATSMTWRVATDVWKDRRFALRLAFDHPHLRDDEIVSGSKVAAREALLAAIGAGRLPGPCPFDRTVDDGPIKGRRPPKGIAEFRAVLDTFSPEQLRDAIDRAEAPARILELARAKLDGRPVPKRVRKTRRSDPFSTEASCTTR